MTSSPFTQYAIEGSPTPGELTRRDEEIVQYRDHHRRWLMVDGNGKLVDVEDHIGRHDDTADGSGSLFARVKHHGNAIGNKGELADASGSLYARIRHNADAIGNEGENPDSAGSLFARVISNDEDISGLTSRLDGASLAFGEGSTATGARSSAFGFRAVANRDDEMVFGTVAGNNGGVNYDATTYRFAGFLIPESEIRDLTPFTPYTDPDNPSQSDLDRRDSEIAKRNADIKAHRDENRRRLFVNGHGTLIDERDTVGKETDGPDSSGSLFARVKSNDDDISGLTSRFESDSLAFGKSSSAVYRGSVAIGEGSNSSSTPTDLGGVMHYGSTTAVGHRSEASGYRSTALGADSEASEHMSLAIGVDTRADHINSTAIGYGAETEADNEIVFGGDRRNNHTTYRFARLGCDVGENCTSTNRNAGLVTVNPNGILGVADYLRTNYYAQSYCLRLWGYFAYHRRPPNCLWSV